MALFSKARPVVLDGGLGTLLADRGHDLTGATWSARLLEEDPAAIVAGHREFFDAGATIAITASYQASFEGFERIGLDREAAARLMRRSVELAREARNGKGALVAASVGPYGAMRADGSEYRGDYGLTAVELRSWHEERFGVLASAGADLVAFETIPCLAEVEAIAALTAGSGVAAWLSVTVADGRLRSGEDLGEAFAIAAVVDEIEAVGLNCSHPSEVLGAIEAARASTTKPVVVYPNSGEEWDGRHKRWMGRPGFGAEQVAAWLDAGATVVGGCCRVGPGQIAGIAAVLAERAVTAPE
jgi:homocysteine S-methyltransferase